MATKQLAEQVKDAFSEKGLIYTETYLDKMRGEVKSVSYGFKVEMDNEGKKETLYNRDYVERAPYSGDKLTIIRHIMLQEILPDCVAKKEASEKQNQMISEDQKN